MFKSRILFLLPALLCQPAHAFEGTWAGLEIVGQRTISREVIARKIPVKIGSKYDQDPRRWDLICEVLKEKFNLHYAHCGMVGYVNFKAYFTIDIVEKGDEIRTHFREAPIGQLSLADGEINSLYDRLYARFWDLFSRGISAFENSDKGYLDYDDSQLSELTAELAQQVPEYRLNILDVLANSADPVLRRRAANLLNWDMHPAEDVPFAVNLLDDPDSEVRNNISRFTLAFVKTVKDSDSQKKIIDALVIQLERPSHGDRNKALFAIFNLLNAFPENASYVKARGLQAIKRISEQSILDNVKGLADEILARLRDQEPR
jgi:hypothetical protein